MKKEIEVGDVFQNSKSEIHEVTSISKGKLLIHARNYDAGNIEKFRYYQSSGEYLKLGTNTEIGILKTKQHEH